MGYFTLGRKSTHIITKVTLKGVELEIVAEGTYDFDEGYFEADIAYLNETRKKTGDYKLPDRVFKYLTSTNCPHAEDWDELARGNF